jgi:exonuclease III
VHAPSEEKSVDSKDSFHEELDQVFEYFPKYHMKFVLGDFNAIMERGDIFKPKIGKEIPHQDSNYNVVRRVNFAT